MKLFEKKVSFVFIDTMSFCSATTKQGSPCKKKRVNSSLFCATHGKKPELPRLPAPRSPPCSALVCTSGYDYDFWQVTEGFQGFYDHTVHKKDRFNVYASEFPALEINSTYYGTPSEKTLKAWRERAEETGHKYIVKVNKFVTHSKKLLDFDETFPRFWKAVSILEDTVEALLFQFSPKFANTRENRERLRKAYTVLKKYENLPHLCFEFRDPSWFSDKKVAAFFEKRDWCLVLPIAVNDEKKWIGTLPSFGIDDISTSSSMVYFRLHGTLGQYIGSYTDSFLRELADITKVLALSGKKVVVAFNNTDSYWYNGIPVPATLEGIVSVTFDKTMSAVRDARQMMKLLQ
ncbi:hypothetical protein D1R32_gp176 [Tunisvirus fontaine2]|uniref:DUF72 domain-containing protein n=1 Tax=Tunisvirus fontaine2 TaxID=1421067 RepID=V9SDC4_9VIRU|nr:hypothetical protein D1R32_gp176 [Tunisvirus fontaine2]AHC54893.1 hypothetical protein TNS_ORF175 [Tunisvirus fontaine2]